MKFFLDTADVREIREGLAMGLVDGVTTNPSLIAQTGRRFREVVEEICEIVPGPVSVEVIGTDVETMMKEAREYSRIRSNVVVKVPLIPEGLKAVRRCAQEGMRTNVTLCFSPTQALLAAKVGANFISPFVGRLDDIHQYSGMEVVRQTLQIFKNYGFTTELIVASIRSPMAVLEAAVAGAHIATIPPAVLRALSKHPLTESGLEKFLADWQKVPK
jgi:transaldolase